MIMTVGVRIGVFASCCTSLGQAVSGNHVGCIRQTSYKGQFDTYVSFSYQQIISGPYSSLHTLLPESLDSRVRNGSKIVEMLKIQINRKFSKVSFKVEQKSITVTLLNIRLCLIQ
jgi:hypothetical protein